MTALFELPARYARISDDGFYRYTLGRRWSPPDGPGSMVFVMLNPSAANAELDDPTIRRCIGFAKREGCGGVHVVNLFAWRATKPEAMFAAQADGHDVIGPENDDTLRETFRAAALEGRPVIAAWGVHGTERAGFVRLLAEAAGARLQALGLTKDGHPRHPLYVRADAQLRVWPAGDES